MQGCVYIIRHRDSGKVYVGQTWRPERRWAEHRGDKDPRSVLNRAIQKHGADAFDYDVVANGYETQPDLDRAEARYIRRYHADERGRGYNLRAGGRGGRMSEETRRRMSEAHRGKSSGAKGKRWSVESRAKMGASWRGKKHSPEHVEKRAVARRGKPVSDQARRNITAAQAKRQRDALGRYA